MKPIFKYRNTVSPAIRPYLEVGQFSYQDRTLSVKEVLELFPKPDVEKFRPYTYSDKDNRGFVVIKVPIETWQEWEAQDETDEADNPLFGLIAALIVIGIAIIAQVLSWGLVVFVIVTVLKATGVLG